MRWTACSDDSYNELDWARGMPTVVGDPSSSLNSIWVMIQLLGLVCGCFLFIYACQWSLASYFWQYTWSTWYNSRLVHPMPYLDGNQHVLAPPVMHELLGVMICFSVGFSVWLGSCCDPSTAWCASKGCSYLFCMLLCNITGSHMASSIIDVEMKIDIEMSIFGWS
jgi:hypothetical protein